MRRLSYSASALSDAGEHQGARGAVVLRGIEDRVAPRLALGVGAARRRAHHVVGQERRRVRPRVGLGVADLEVAVEREPLAPAARAEPRVLVVREQLAERVALERELVAGDQRLVARRRGRLVAGRGLPQHPVGIGPGPERPAAVLRAQRGEQPVAIEPRRVVPPEPRERRGEIGARAVPQPRVRLREQRVRDVVRAGVLRGAAAAREHGVGQGRLVDEPLEHAAGAQRGERDRAEVAREDRPVVRRWVVARGLPLRSELEPGEPELACEPEQAGRRARGRGAAAEVLVEIRGKARVVDREQHPPDAELGERGIDQLDHHRFVSCACRARRRAPCVQVTWRSASAVHGETRRRYFPMTSVIKATAFVLMFLIGCATAPKTADDQRALEARALGTLNSMIAKDPDLRDIVDRSAGYVVFPSVGKGGAIVGGAFGRGVLYENGQPTGFVKLEQAGIGAMLGGQTFAELLVLTSPRDVQAIRAGNYQLSANVDAIILTTGAAANANFDSGVAAFVMPLGGLMVDVSVNGQRFQFEPPMG